MVVYSIFLAIREMRVQDFAFCYLIKQSTKAVSEMSTLINLHQTFYSLEEFENMQK